MSLGSSFKMVLVPQTRYLGREKINALLEHSHIHFRDGNPESCSRERQSQEIFMLFLKILSLGYQNDFQI